MAILKIRYNSRLFADLSTATAGVVEAMKNAQVGEFWAGDYGNGAVLAFKGADGVSVFSNADALTAEFQSALQSYYTKEEIDNLFATKLADYYTKEEVDAAVKVAKDAADAAQGAADAAQGDINEHVADKNVHIQEGEREAWNKAKEDIDAFLGTAVSEQEAVIDTLKEIQDFLSAEEGGKVKEMLDKIQAAQDAAEAAQGAADAAQGAADAAQGAADAAQGEVDALEEVVSEHKEEFETFKTTNSQAIADAQAAAEKVATDAKAEIDAYTVNGKAISTNPVLVASDIAVTPNDILTSENVQVALEELQSEIAGVVANGVTSVVAGDAITVDDSDVNNPVVSVNVDDSSVKVVNNKLSVDVIDCGTY